MDKHPFEDAARRATAEAAALPNRRERRAARTLARRRYAEPQDLALLTYAEAARLCSVHKDTICAAVARGDLVSVNAPGTRGTKGRRITRRSLQAFQSRQLAAQESQ